MTTEKYGHNSGELPPLINVPALLDEITLRSAHLLGRRVDMLEAFDRWHNATNGSINDADMQAKSVDFWKQMKAASDALEAARKECKEPILTAGKGIDTHFANLRGPLDASALIVRGAMESYAQALADAEAASRRAEASRLASEAARQVESAEQRNDAEAVAVAEMAEDRAIAERRAAAAPRAGMEAARVSGDLGASASLVGKWVYIIEDEGKIPREFLMPNDAAIKAAIKSRTIKGHCTVQIAGVKITFERSLRVR